MQTLHLAPGRERSVRRYHPWLFSGAIRRRQGSPADGLAEVVSAEGITVARGLACPGSALEARLWTFGDEEFSAATIRARFEAARRLRHEVIAPQTTGYRLLHSEGDDTPGIIADRYGGTDVLVLAAGGAAVRSAEFEENYRRVFTPGKLVVRLGDQAPSPPGQDVTASFLEYGIHFLADVAGGQKTGFFLDQRENRHRIRSLARGRTLLNCFSYSGGFSVAALAGGARRCVDVDSSAGALDLAREHRRLNGFPADEEDFVETDVFQELRRRVEAAEQWDIIVCDPPAFAKKKADVDRAARGYKDLLRLSMRLVKPEGVLLACSCSGLVSAELFQKIIFAAALDARASLAIFERAGAGPDHPVSLYCPETEYLKAFFLRKRG